MKTFEIQQPEELEQVASYLLNHSEHRILALYGDLGAGKTSLAIEIAKKLGVDDPVTSPTFAIVNEYETEAGDPFYHFDFYRIETEEEALDIGFHSYTEQRNAWCLIEWPERIESVLPVPRMDVKIDVLPNGRKLSIEAYDGI